MLLGKLMYKLTGGKVNPLIGSAGVSAVPMAARVAGMDYPVLVRRVLELAAHE